MADRAVGNLEWFVHRLIRLGSREGLLRSGLLCASCDVGNIARNLTPLWGAPNLQITELRVNGPRLDVRVRADDGRAWLTVMWVNAVPETELVGMELYERPLTFQPRPPGTVIVLNGPSSVGKSSLMAAFADAADTPWACVDEPTLGRLATKFLAWPATAGPVRDGFLAALAAAAAVGNQLIVSTAGIPQDRFRDALTGIPTVYVGLHASLDILIERQLTQADKFGGLAEQSVGIHDGWEYDLDIDTASQQPAGAAHLLAEFLDANTTDTTG